VKGQDVVVLIVGNKNIIVYKENEEIKEDVVNNNINGVKDLIEILNKLQRNIVIVVGNHEWSKPFVIALKKLAPNIKVVYCPSPKKGRGVKENLRLLARKIITALDQNKQISFKEYIIEPIKGLIEEPESYTLSLEYTRIVDNIRRIKHKIYSILRYIAPELTEGVERLLKNNKLPTWIFVFDVIEKIKNDEDMLAFYVYNNNPVYFNRKVEELKKLFEELEDNLDKKKEKLREISRDIDKNHPLIKLFSEISGRKKIPDSLIVLIGFIGNRKWGYRSLRKYIGLETIHPVTGRPRLDRRRPEVRQYVYIVSRTTTLGKLAWEWFREKYKDNPKYQEKIRKYRGTMMIEAFLQYICLHLDIFGLRK